MGDLPPDFGPGHPDWNVPSKRQRWNLSQNKEANLANLEKKKKLLVRPVSTEDKILDLEKKKQLLSRPVSPMVESPKLSFCITTMVSEEYQWYIPLFIDRIRKEYPEYSVKVILRGKNDLIGHSELWNRIEPYIYIDKDDPHPTDGLFTAAYRFLAGQTYYMDYDYILMTDVDILVKRESPGILEKHLEAMKIRKLTYYNNYVIDDRLGKKMMPGVHFMSRAWWEKTTGIRKLFLKNLLESEEIQKGADEKLLYWIVLESGVEISDVKYDLFANHGIHLGEYRKQLSSRFPIEIDAITQKYIEKLYEDDEFMFLVEKCGSQLPEILEMFSIFKRAVK